MKDRLIARFVLGTFRIFRALHGGSRALFEGFWLAVLPERIRDAATTESYGSGRNYTNDIWVDSGLQFWEELAIGSYFPKAGRVLVAAAGGGREMIALVRMGYRVEGFECSLPMVEAGRTALRLRGMDAPLQWAPPSRLPELTSEFHAAIIGWNAWSYIVPAQRRLEFLRELQTHLVAGAPVLISAGVASEGNGAWRWIALVANLIRRLTFRPGDIEAGMSFPTRPRQDFTRSKLQAEVLKAGLKWEKWYQWGPFGAAVVRK